MTTVQVNKCINKYIYIGLKTTFFISDAPVVVRSTGCRHSTAVNPAAVMAPQPLSICFSYICVITYHNEPCIRFDVAMPINYICTDLRPKIK